MFESYDNVIIKILRKTCGNAFRAMYFTGNIFGKQCFQGFLVGYQILDVSKLLRIAKKKETMKSIRYFFTSTRFTETFQFNKSFISCLCLTLLIKTPKPDCRHAFFRVFTELLYMPESYGRVHTNKLKPYLPSECRCKSKK